MTKASGEELCETCGKSRSNVTSITQWISLGDKCACTSGGGQRMTPSNSFFRLPKLCKKCGGSISRGAGSMTQWVFRTTPCECAEPEIDTSQAPALPAQSIDLETIYADDTAGVELDAARFPLDRYIPLELLGTGQEGDVYKCTDKILRRRVCVKLLKTRKLSPEQAIRFQREAQAGSKLKHPNLAMTLDFGMTESEQPYLVLEFCDGVSLSKIVQDDVLMLHTKLDLLAQIAQGMQHAHDQGVLHRDLKTSNVIVLKSDDEQPVAKVVDFGLSVLTDAADDAGRITENGSLIGTPTYMSPEHASGAAIDERADIYSFGCIMFETLTGRVPFEADSLYEVLKMQRESKVPSFSEVMPENDLPDELEKIVEVALAKEPGERYQTMAEVHARLHKFLVDNFDFVPINLKADDAGSLPSALPAALLAAKQSELDPQKAAFNRGVLILVGVIGFAVAIFWIYDRVLKPDQSSGGKVPLSGKLYEPVFAGKGIEGIETKFSDELAQQAYGISADTTSQALLQDTEKPHGDIEQVTLALTGRKLNKVDFERATRYPHLEGIDFSGARGITAEDLSLLKKAPSLRTLRMDRVALDSGELKVLAELPLEKLFLVNCKLSDSACVILATSDTLKQLDVSENAVTSNGIANLTLIKTLMRLRFEKTTVPKGRVFVKTPGWSAGDAGWYVRTTENKMMRIMVEE